MLIHMCQRHGDKHKRHCGFVHTVVDEYCSISPAVFSSINGTIYVRFTSVPKETIQMNFTFPTTDFVLIYFSTQVQHI